MKVPPKATAATTAAATLSDSAAAAVPAAWTSSAVTRAGPVPIRPDTACQATVLTAAASPTSIQTEAPADALPEPDTAATRKVPTMM